MKKIIAGISVLAAMLFMANYAAAATIDNVDGGSTADAHVSSRTTTTVTNSNTADVLNTVTVTADSGNNTVTSGRVQNGTTISTGNSASKAAVFNVANINATSITVDPVNNTDSVSTVGGGSDVVLTNRDRVRNTVDNSNAAIATNSIVASSNTGANTVTTTNSRRGALNNTSLTTGTNCSGSLVGNAFNVNLLRVNRTIVSR